MKAPFEFFCSAAWTSLAAAAMITAMAAQAQQDDAGGAEPQIAEFAAPRNLKALPRSMTGKQVHDLMEQW
jgi:uncharacterized membrane protein